MNNAAENKERTTPPASFGELFGQLINSSTAIIHDEIELVIQEVNEKTRRVRGGILTVAAGAAIGFAAFISLCAALIIGLSAYMPPVIAALITGTTLTISGGIIVFIGYRQLKKSLFKA